MSAAQFASHAFARLRRWSTRTLCGCCTGCSLHLGVLSIELTRDFSVWLLRWSKVRILALRTGRFSTSPQRCVGRGVRDAMSARSFGSATTHGGKRRVSRLTA